MSHDVFISYSSSDQKVVEALSHYLEERGVRCFVAYRDIPKGKVWAIAITEAIESCQLMVVVFSKDFNNSVQVDREIELCSEEKKPILTFRIQNEEFKGAKKFYLKNINWIDAFPNPDECFQNLYESVVKLINANNRGILINNPSDSIQEKLRREREEVARLKKEIEEQQLAEKEYAALQAERQRLEHELAVKRRVASEKVKLVGNTHVQSDANTKQESSVPPSFIDNFTETINGVSFDMVAVEGGDFMMGSAANVKDRSDDELQHKVTLSSYYIGKTPVTQALWMAVMSNNLSSFKGETNPVEYVSWFDTVYFCNELSRLKGLQPAYTITSRLFSKNVVVNSNASGFRLPTEAEWEFAARGGNRSNGFKYAGCDSLDKVAWYGKNSGGETHPVAQKLPNELGLYDMSGNVWEWCWDWHDNYYATIQTNPIGPSSGSRRVCRGGSWFSDALDCHIARRLDEFPINSGKRIGFRLVLPQ